MAATKVFWVTIRCGKSPRTGGFIRSGTKRVARKKVKRRYPNCKIIRIDEIKRTVIARPR